MRDSKKRAEKRRAKRASDAEARLLPDAEERALRDQSTAARFTRDANSVNSRSRATRAFRPGKRARNMGSCIVLPSRSGGRIVHDDSLVWEYPNGWTGEIQSESMGAIRANKRGFAYHQSENVSRSLVDYYLTTTT